MNPASRIRSPSGATIFAALTALVLAFTLATSAHAESTTSWWQRLAGNTVTGSGKAATEARPLTGFRAVALRTGIDVVLRQATTDAVEVRADDNLIALVETRVVDRGGVPTLEIDTRRGTGFSSHHPVVVHVAVAKLEALSISGSGDVAGDGIQAATLAVSVTGSGDVKLTQLKADALSVKVTGSGDVAVGGRSASLGVTIVGSGDVDARGLDADDVKVDISGSGDAKVTASKTLAVSINGSGDVSYSGNAALTSRVAGSGSVNKR